MVKRTSIQEENLKIVQKTRGVEENEEEFQNVKRFSHHLLRHTRRRPQRWEARHTRKKVLVNVGMSGNTKVFMGIFWWEVGTSQENLKKGKLYGAEAKKNKKSSKTSPLSLMAKAPQNQRKKTEARDESIKLVRHLKLC